MNTSSLFDPYSFRARLQPALLTLLPAALGIFAWSGPYAKWESALWTLFGTLGGTFFLAAFARNRGKQIEPGLWASWGGAPTTQMLRHAGRDSAVLTERRHKFLAKLLGKPFPSAEEEKANPTAADEIYLAGIKLLINKTRDTKKFHLIYKENVQYGFGRNLYAMRAIGLTFALLGSVSSLMAGLASLKSGQSVIYPWVCLAADIVFFGWWVMFITPAWVRVPAFAYAERLLESVENLPQTRKPSAPREEAAIHYPKTD